MDQMRIDAATRRERIEARLVMELQSLPCPNRGIPHQLDREGTVLASWKTDDLVLVYRPCGICQGAADIVDKSSWLHKAGVPSIMLGCCIETWKPDTSAHHRVARAVREWAAHPKGFLVITGKPGVGKTHLAISAMKLVRHGRLITQTNFLAGIRKRYAEPGAPDVLAQLKVRKFLVFDELGHGTGARDEYSNVYELLDYRHGEGLPTIVTTNSAPEDFTQDLGDRLADRLAAHQPFLCIHGESWRGR